MSVLDRVRRTTATTNRDGDPQSSGSKSTTPTAKSAVARRINLVVNELVDYADKQAESPFRTHLWLVKALFQGIAEELGEAEDEVLAHWIGQFGRLLEWCATGDNSVLPPEVLAYMNLLQETRNPHALAIEATKA